MLVQYQWHLLCNALFSGINSVTYEKVFGLKVDRKCSKYCYPLTAYFQKWQCV